ncbi:MAG: hypothetical protein ABN482_04555 [Corticimicrobacter sp.]|uniref:hypothetical protein n=1 Tax=Corticimicrobacter sp. TaxID=2678536 RepID=UPI0032DA8FB8
MPIQIRRLDATTLRAARTAGMIGTLLVLTACASPADIAVGTAQADIYARFGLPTHTCPLPDGGQRQIWSQQPNGQYAWALETNASGTVQSNEPVLTDASFQRLATGRWTPEQVVCAFGPPAEIGEVGLPSVRQTVWSYRYRQDHVWNSLMYVYFGNGDTVTRFHPGPDPRYEVKDGSWLR